MLTADDYTQLATARLFDFFNRHASWHVALWGIGTALALEEVAEYSDLTRAGAFPSKDGLKYVAGSTRTLVADDPAVAPDPLKTAVLDALEVKSAESEAGAATLRHLADRVRDGYLARLAAAARSANSPGVETLASAAATHLLDLDFSSGFLHGWLRDLVRVDARSLHVADLLEEGATLCKQDLQDFEVVVPFLAIPGGYLGRMPDGWLDGQQTKEWMDELDQPPEGDHRQAGSVVIDVRARDPWTAVEVAAELVTQVSARVAVGSRSGRLRTKGIGWVAGHVQAFPLNPQTRVQLRSLKTAEQLFEIAADQADAAVLDALEIFSALESGTRGAAMTGGWAAVEGLLLRRSESPHVLAADRLAAIVACAFPRAELTTLSYRHRPNPADALKGDLEGVTSNLDRCRIVEAAIRNGNPPIPARPSDRALLQRVEGMVLAPADKLGNVRRYVGDTVRRLYTQRNLIMHAGSFQSVTLEATLRTAPRLIAAGMDRVVDASLGSGVDPLALAARAEVELQMLGTPAARPLSDLLG